MDVEVQEKDAVKSASGDADRLRLWLEGERAVAGARDLLLETGADVELASRVSLGIDAAVFVSEDDVEGTVSQIGGHRVVRYDGALEIAGGELCLFDDMIVQTEGYATAPYVSISVPTAFAVVDELDLAALRADLAAARATGVLPAYLTTALATVVDQRRWLEPLLPDDDAPRRLLLCADGTLRDGPGGRVVSADGSIDPSHHVPPAEDAGEIARFLGAAKVVRALRARLGREVSVAGYDGKVGSVGAGRTDSVFVASDDASSYVVDIATSRIDRVPDAVATVVEQTLCARAGTGDGGDAGRAPEGSERVLEALALERFLPASADRAL
ncbi:hypothetical protein [Cellulomonas sp. PhB143]|uniref:hypothetical protein n=1 Tax=Cellulomonas sp. PhB143 TaxID=2485186 RepID=UPI000FC26988|nr:hypothetical protein [Cellulomonas sp. PhB143]ROS76627.1 hypothetical protein EDF32_1448 [Cellulomonas sp. PhB143]